MMQQEQNKLKYDEICCFIAFWSYFITLVIYSFICFDWHHLQTLGYPISSNNEICQLSPNSYSFLYINLNPYQPNGDPLLLCVSQCPNKQNNYEIFSQLILQNPTMLGPSQQIHENLDGICLSPNKMQLLKHYQTDIYKSIKQYELVLKHLSLMSLLYFFLAFIIVIVLIILLRQLTYKYSVISAFILLIFTLVLCLLIWTNHGSLYESSSYLLLIISCSCVIILIYTTFLLLFRSKQPEQMNAQKYITEAQNHIQNYCAMISYFLFYFVLAVGFILLISWQLVAFISSEKFVTVGCFWINEWSYKEVLVLIQGYMMLNLLYFFNQYLTTSIFVNKILIDKKSDDIVSSQISIYISSIKSSLCIHASSICKITVINCIFWLPIYFLNLIKPKLNKYHGTQLQTIKQLFNFCGFILNLAQKYSVNPFYWMLMKKFHKKSCSLSKSAFHSHYIYHIQYPYSQQHTFYINELNLKSSVLCLISIAILVIEWTYFGMIVSKMSCLFICAIYWISCISWVFFRIKGGKVVQFMHLIDFYESQEYEK